MKNSGFARFERKLKEYKLWIYDNRNRSVREMHSTVTIIKGMDTFDFIT